MSNLIDTLNATARAIDSGDAWKDLEAAAQQHGLTRIAVSPTCHLYRAADGALVNCWVDGGYSHNIEAGGIGFDDQTGWYEAPASIRAFRLPVGAAEAEGRAPSHDGEYLTIIYRGEEWICESNAGVTATSHFPHADNATWGSDEELEAAEALDARIAAAVAAEGDAEPLQSCGTEARNLLNEMGWTTPDQWDGNDYLG